MIDSTRPKNSSTRWLRAVGSRALRTEFPAVPRPVGANILELLLHRPHVSNMSLSPDQRNSPGNQ